MNALPGMPATPADVWSGAGVWHVSAIARLLVPDARATDAAVRRVPRPRTSPETQRVQNTSAR